MVGTNDTIFSSIMKYSGIFNFPDFYQFCYDWLTEEPQFELAEEKYEEKLSGDAKEIIVEWEGTKKMNDYFKFIIKVEIIVRNLTQVEGSGEITVLPE